MQMLFISIKSPIHVLSHTPFENLVLDDEVKRTIASLVRNYTESRKKIQSWSTDFIKDKGEGLVFLLHGSPGVGKT
jgi:hypothetical protein